MFQLHHPVGELVVRTTIVYLALLVLVRISGKRTIGEFTPFDLVVVILIGESAQNGLMGDEASVFGTMIVSASLVGLNLVVAVLSARSRVVLRLTEGSPVLLARNGELFVGALRANHIPRAHVDEAIRQANLASLEEVELATLEASGVISIVPRKR